MLKGKTNEERTYNYLYEQIGNKYGVCGLMDNINAESAFKPNNLQNSGNKSLDMTDSEYTDAVDSGMYSRNDFVKKHKSGFGICQWTYHTRKAALYDFAKKKGASIGDLEMQLEFLVKELKTSYKAVWKALCNATSVKEASDIVLLKFEKPKNKSEENRLKRSLVGETYYKKYADLPFESVKVEEALKYAKSHDKNFTVKTALNLRIGAGTEKKVITTMPAGSIVRCHGEYTPINGVPWLLVYYGEHKGYCVKGYLK